MNKKILIITGSGALVGAKFYNNLIKKLNTKYNLINDDEYPFITLMNIPFDLNHKGEINDLDEFKKVINKIDFTEYNNVYFLCNSLAKEMSNIINDKKYINIIKVTEKYTKSSKQNILIGSKNTFEKCLYKKTNFYKHSKQIQIVIDDIINLILINTKESKKEIEKNLKILKDYYDVLGIDNIILSCTEMYLIKSDIKKIFEKDYNIYCSTTIYLKELIKNLNLTIKN